MDALTNAETYEKTGSGFAPTAIPEAKSSHTGVSVRYVRDTDSKKWYLFRASYGREDLAADYLINAGIYAYVPKREETVLVDGRRKHLLKSMLPNLVFAYLTDADARRHVQGPAADDADYATSAKMSAILSYYYNHCQSDTFGKNPPLTITCSQMENFIRLTMTHDENVMELHGNYTFKTDDEVTVIGGKFKGVKGRVIRANRQQRVLVELSGFMSFATAYVPSAFLSREE